MNSILALMVFAGGIRLQCMVLSLTRGSSGRLHIVLTGAVSGGGRMSDRRFVFAFPHLNLYEVIWAMSAAEARHRLMNSDLAPYYGIAVLLNP